MVDAGSPEVASTRDKDPTDVSPALVGSTAVKDWWYIGGMVASAVQ
jgi:hypothetical protein